MKEVKMYICEKCYQYHFNKNDAIKCEKRHTKPISVNLIQEFKPGLDETTDGYPQYVNVTMENGNVCEYEFVTVVDYKK